MNKARLSLSGSSAAILNPITLRAFTKWPEGPTLDPHEIQLVHGWHCVGEPGSWDLERLCSDLGEKLVHSHWNGTPPGPERSRRCHYLVFALAEDVVVAISEHTSDVRVLRVWAHSAARCEAEFQRLRTTYFREPSQNDDAAHFLVFLVCFFLIVGVRNGVSLLVICGSFFCFVSMCGGLLFRVLYFRVGRSY